MNKLFLILCVVVAPALAEDDPTWVEIDGVVYGAKPDDRGPIGGGTGYNNVVTKGDYTVKNLNHLIECLKKAKAGQTVFIPGRAIIDLTARIYVEQLVLEVPEGVTLASNRGQKGSLGALLTSDALKTPVMIRAAGPNVRITGLRLRGPCAKRYRDHHARAFKDGGPGHKYYYKFPTSNGIQTTHDGLEVDNCEISGFAAGGISLAKGADHQIHHNFIHHCQYHGLGYGISHSNSQSLIEFNLFDYNRHSIASTGRPGTSYVARRNVELGVNSTYCFDVHGGKDRKDGTNIAGTSTEVANNTFRLNNVAFWINGVPEKSCEVHHNWFPKHDELDDKVLRYQERTRVFDNAYGPPAPEAPPKVIK